MKRISIGVAVTTAVSCVAGCGQTVSPKTESSARSSAVDQAVVQRLLDSALGRIMFVDWSGTLGCTTIQEALDVSTDGDTIIVLPSEGSPDGAYVENIHFPARAITLRSFDPGDPATVSATIIDGNAIGSVVTFDPGAMGDTVLDGFTIRNGQAGYGGGIYCDSTSPTIRRCTIVGNVAMYGGGVYCGFSHPTIDRCRIYGNSADYGGGMHNWYSSSPTLTSCTFSGNEAVGCG